MLDDYQRFLMGRMNRGETAKEVADRLLKIVTAPKCNFCEMPAELLCDHRVARCRETGEELVCSAPVCESCTTRNDGVVFYSGADGGVDTFDFCPDHKHSHFGRLPDQIVNRAELYRMEKHGKGLILVKENAPMLVSV